MTQFGSPCDTLCSLMWLKMNVGAIAMWKFSSRARLGKSGFQRVRYEEGWKAKVKTLTPAEDEVRKRAKDDGSTKADW